MCGPTPDAERPWRDAAREERLAQQPHRRASWAAGSIAGYNGCVAIYAAVMTLAFVIGWVTELIDGTSTPLVSALYGACLAVLLGSACLMGFALHKLTVGSLGDGRGTHLGLILGAGGAGVVTVVLIGFGFVRDQLATGGWTMPCACVGAWPILVAFGNVFVLVRHGSALRQEDAVRYHDV